MPKPPAHKQSKKPAKKRPQPVAATTPAAGPVYRVRDKDYNDGRPVKVWGEHLTYDEARKLKTRVAASGKSSTVRCEQIGSEPYGTDRFELDTTFMSTSSARPWSGVVTPGSALHPDPVIADVQKKAMAAARPIAAQAQARAQAAAPPPDTRLPKPPVMELDDDGDDAALPDIEPTEGEGDDIAAAEAEADEEFKAYDQGGQELFLAWLQGRGSEPTGGGWDDLTEKDRAGFRYEAANKVGPHYEAVHGVTS